MGIGKLGPGRYRILVDLGRGPDGRRRQHTEIVRGAKKEAERRERELLQNRASGAFVEPHRKTVAEYMTVCLESGRNKVEPNTYEG